MLSNPVGLEQYSSAIDNQNQKIIADSLSYPSSETLNQSSNINEQLIFNNTPNLKIDDSPFASPLIESGLVFEKAFAYRSEEDSTEDKIRLLGLTAKAQAIQFRIQVNKSVDDSTFLIINSLEKGADLSNPGWILDYNIIRGPTYPNGASKDEVFVLIYHVNQNGGLDPGDYFDLIKVKYEVAEFEDLQDSVKSSFKITHAQASTFQGTPIDITPSRDEFKIIVRGIIPEFGLIFEEDTVYRMEDDSYVDNMKLVNLEFKAQALQFRLFVNNAVDDNVILSFMNIEKGADVSDPSWVLTYNVFRGPLTGNGASIDEILVLLWNLNQNNGLLPGDYDELLKVKYGVANLPALQDSVKSSIKISNAEASTFEGFPINITPSRDELTVIVRNRVGLWGDVNGDGCLDILDIIMIVDHIVGRDSLEVDEFLRADIAPWIPGHPEPDSDGLVNVQDLSLLQNIILLGEYPNGGAINGCSITSINKLSGSYQHKLTFYINENGITAYSNSEIDLRGVQIEFGNVSDDPENTIISTDLGQGYYLKVDELLRVLLYDRQGIKVINSGERLLADIPFRISNPESITIEKVILIDINRHRVMDNEIEIEIIHGDPPFIPKDFILFQNYPNPFNPATTIQYTIPEDCRILLKVFDVLGNEITTLVDEVKNRGIYSVNFGSADISSGIYFYQLFATSASSGKIFTETKKMVLIK